jgi:glutathione S-transferase
MNFYTVNGSPNCRKVHAVINYLGLDVNIIELDLLSGDLEKPEFLALNPNGLVPVL